MQIRFRHVIAGLTSVVAALARAAGAQAASSPRKGNAGTVSLRVKCNQAGKVKLTGTLTQPIGAKRGHGKQKSKRYKLAPLSGSARAGRMLTLTVSSQRRALTALGHGAKESAMFTVTLAGGAWATTKVATSKGTR